jgi:hypothetical protein
VPDDVVQLACDTTTFFTYSRLGVRPPPPTPAYHDRRKRSRTDESPYDIRYVTSAVKIAKRY